MPKACSVCTHERREEIDRDLLAGEKTLPVSQRFDLTNATIKAHRRSGHHIVGSTPRPWTASHTADDLLGRIQECRGDPDALRSLRLAASTLPPEERIVLIEELRRRAGKVPVRMAA